MGELLGNTKEIIESLLDKINRKEALSYKEKIMINLLTSNYEVLYNPVIDERVLAQLKESLESFKMNVSKDGIHYMSLENDQIENSVVIGVNKHAVNVNNGLLITLVVGFQDCFIPKDRLKIFLDSKNFVKTLIECFSVDELITLLNNSTSGISFTEPIEVKSVEDVFLLFGEETCGIIKLRNYYLIFAPAPPSIEGGESEMLLCYNIDIEAKIISEVNIEYNLEMIMNY